MVGMGVVNVVLVPRGCSVFSAIGLLISVANYLTHSPLVPHIRVNELGHQLVHLMACRLFCAKPLPEPMLAYCQLDSREQISLKVESKLYHIHSRKCI